MSFENTVFRLKDYGGKNFGHPLIYYTKSYLGETIRLTTTIADLNKLDENLVIMIKGALENTGLPIIKAFLPTLAASQGIVNKLFEAAFNGIVSLWNYKKQDKIISENDLDLEFERIDKNNLQSGRIVCIPNSKNAENFIKNYKLTTGDNMLVKKQPDVNGKHTEYTDDTYYVIKVQNKKIESYENFEYLQNASELLTKTNRSSYKEIVDGMTSIAAPLADTELLKKINDLKYAGGKNRDAEIKALASNMTTQGRNLYTPLIDKLLNK